MAPSHPTLCAPIELISRYFGVQFYLEDLFGKPVDLITERALRPELKPFIDRDRINV